MALGERHGRWRFAAGSVGVLLALALASCTTDDEPNPGTAPPATENSSSASEEPTEVGTSGRPEVEKPAPPDAMRRDDVAGAEAAAQYFLQLYPYVYATGDLSEWEAMSDPECEFCNSVIDGAGALHEGGGWSTGGEVAVESVEGQSPADGNALFRVNLLVNQSPSTDVDGTGGHTENPGGRNMLIFAIRNDGDHWIVREVQIEDPDFEDAESDA